MPAIGVEIEAFDVFFMIDASGLVCGLELEGGNPIRERLMVSLKRSSARVRKDTHLMGMSPNRSSRRAISETANPPASTSYRPPASVSGGERQRVHSP